MFNIAMKFFRNKEILFYCFLFIPFIFILIGNRNLVFISFISVALSFTITYDDFAFTVALPVSRKSIVKGNYLAYLLLILIHLTYLGIILYVIKNYFHLETDDSFSLLGFLYSINLLAIFSLIIPLTLRSKLSNNTLIIRFFPVTGFLLMLPFISDFEFLNSINILVHFGITIIIVLLSFLVGYRDSLKTIAKIEF